MEQHTEAREVWKPVSSYEGIYEVSDAGRVRSVARFDAAGHWRDGREMTTRADADGYLRVPLCKLGKKTSHGVHRLVLSAFEGEPQDGAHACHNDGNPANNRLTNLRWDTASANARDRVQHGRDEHRRRTHCIRGHALVAPNLLEYALLRNRRACRTCSRFYSAAKVAGWDQVASAMSAEYERIMAA